jgi:hypothetical protein
MIQAIGAIVAIKLLLFLGCAVELLFAAVADGFVSAMIR